MYYKRSLISIYKTIKLSMRVVRSTRVATSSQRHYTHLVLSYKHRLYLNLYYLIKTFTTSI
nr:MAG TPA: hypothetical protein [Caudoviricetes sp.]